MACSDYIVGRKYFGADSADMDKITKALIDQILSIRGWLQDIDEAIEELKDDVKKVSDVFRENGKMGKRK